MGDLNDVLCEAILKCTEEPEYVKQAQSVANLTGKVIAGQKLTLDYQVKAGRKPKIKFLNGS